MNEEKKEKAIKLAIEMGLMVSFTNEKGIYYTTDGHSRKMITWDEIFFELEKQMKNIIS